jgi:UDP-3-O-[3-hydroxymyristoyl] glucosamine N-acyltransferase
MRCRSIVDRGALDPQVIEQDQRATQFVRAGQSVAIGHQRTGLVIEAGVLDRNENTHARLQVA